MRTEPSKESVIWMNTILEKAWPKVAPWAEEFIKSKGKEEIEKVFRKSKPPVVVIIYLLFQVKNIN